MSYSVAIF